MSAQPYKRYTPEQRAELVRKARAEFAAAVEANKQAQQAKEASK